MAGITRSRGGNMAGWLACGARSVMAGAAGTGSNQRMGIAGRQPGRCFMARIAGRSGLHMGCRLTRDCTAVMAGIAGARHYSLGDPVLKTAWRPADISVTGVAGG